MNSDLTIVLLHGKLEILSENCIRTIEHINKRLSGRTLLKGFLLSVVFQMFSQQVGHILCYFL